MADRKAKPLGHGYTGSYCHISHEFSFEVKGILIGRENIKRVGLVVFLILIRISLFTDALEHIG